MSLQDTKSTLSKAEQIINSGLIKAAQSMAFFTRSNVSIESIDFQIKPITKIHDLLNLADDQLLYSLKTNIIGDISGVCYLIFDQNEVNEIVSIGLPKSILEDPEKCAEMTDAILLEMDNIIVASVVSELANALGCKIFGDVPSLEKMTKEILKEYLFEASNSLDKAIYFKSDFKNEGAKINPEFIWLLDDNYLQRIQAL